MSAFDAWFTAQFGKRQKSDEPDNDLKDIALGGKMAQEELDRRRRWDELRSAALYGWQVSDTDKSAWDQPKSAIHGSAVSRSAT